MSNRDDRLEKLAADYRRDREGQERQLDKTRRQLRKQEELQADYFALINRNLNLVHELMWSHPRIIEVRSCYEGLQYEATLATNSFEYEEEKLIATKRSIEQKMDEAEYSYHLESRRIQASEGD